MDTDRLLSLVQAAYLIAGVLFILSLAGLSHQRSAKAGNTAGKIGMVIALAATVALSLLQSEQNSAVTAALIAAALLIGAVIGTRVARRVEMTQMPEMIAILHSFVGLAAVLVGFNSYLTEESSSDTVHLAEVFVGIFIGAVTFTGSIVAYLKLSAKIKSAPLTLPGRNWLNLGALIVSAALLMWFLLAPSIWAIGLMTVIALLLGLHLVAAIGGGDMPVVVSMLNSYSGWAAAAAGFMLGNNLLIITGALVGSSGAILSYIMCKAMNRRFTSVILGGFGNEAAAAPADGQDLGEHREITPAQLAELLEEAHSIVIAPGYGMAVAKAQNQVADLTRETARDGQTGSVRRAPGGGSPARAHERLAGRGAGAVRHRAGDGRDSARPARYRRGPGDRRQRHRESRRRGRSEFPYRRHARAAGLEGQARRGVQAFDGDRVRGRAEPVVLQGQRRDAVR